MPPAEQRKTLRRQVRYPASIEIEGSAETIACRLCDASEEGAQLELGDPAALPEEFNLVLSYDGTVRRRCKIKWRAENQVGVVFKKAAKASPSRGFKARAQAAEKVDIETLPSNPDPAQ